MSTQFSPTPCPSADPRPTPQADPQDWPEDAAHENGNYQNLCVGCGTTFIGHKRRVVCRQCYTSATAPNASLGLTSK